MAYDYADRMVWLDDLVAPLPPGGGYALCEYHAGRFTAPIGWTLIDRRDDIRPLFASLEVA